MKKEKSSRILFSRTKKFKRMEEYRNMKLKDIYFDIWKMARKRDASK